LVFLIDYKVHTFFCMFFKVMESSAQYKNIVQKWDISPEHPGFAVSPLLEKFREDYRTLGTFSKIHYYIQAHSGPRFWDKPINEGCFMKGLSLVKYAAFSSMFYFNFYFISFF
jgi:hypothetical protein